jgi:hypothetical protein
LLLFLHSGITTSTSGLVYQDESGALNEAVSDIFGALVDRQEGATGNDIWLIGEDIYTPSTPGDAFRSMADPAAYNDFDYYPTRYTGSSDNGGVHWNSGIANLAFKLLVTGGSHPRGKTNVVVNGIGFEAAAEIFYYGSFDCLTPSSTFEMARFCTADEFGGEFRDNVHQAWDAVGVPGGVSPAPVMLEDGVLLSGQRSATVLKYILSGILTGDTVACSTTASTGDADLYLRFGEEPSWDPEDTENDCPSYSEDSNEECSTGQAAAPTTLYIAVYAWGGNEFTDLTIQCSITRAIQSTPTTNSPQTPSLTKTPTRAPTRPPTRAPTRRPTRAPTRAPRPTAPTPGPGGCFSGETLVHELKKGAIQMSYLQIGDHVLTASADLGGTVYQPVYGFGHYHTSKPTEFLQIHYGYESLNQTGSAFVSPLEMTGKHLLHVERRSNPIRADAVQVGDILRRQDSEAKIRVTRIEKITRNGVYAPFTPSGTIIVQEAGIVASTYISLQESAQEHVQIGNGMELYFLSQQNLCHVWMAPYRVYCMYKDLLPEYTDQPFCQGETYTERGRSFWVHQGKSFAEWGDEQAFLLQVLVLAVILTVLGFALLIEAILAASFASKCALLIGLIATVRVARNIKKRLL